MARLPYIDASTASPILHEGLQALPPLNVFAMLAHAESAVVPYLSFAGVLLTQLKLDPKLRELTILLVAARTGAEYEWIQHVGISRALGIDEAQITAIQQDDLTATCLTLDAQILLRFASQVLEQPRADDDAFTALSDRFSPREIVEILLVIGNYHTLARIMTNLEIDLDAAIGATVIDEAQRRLNDGS
ncbi:MAG: carboxymuconolactone decarboxylase family protein [Solirubrobacteraceae bacterium]